ncbi:MAG: LacI family DNA-binding transcriptional regulator [Opitutaceae bacterium]|nr:LacI family DNA-binding transcriptional regulator [Opitutaceae bacterium]
MNRPRVTLAAIATQAGVHVTTVSLALRNSPRLPAATRERIRKLADELGYAPDPMLQALVAYRGNTAARRSPPTLAYVTNWNTRMGWREVTAHPDFYAGAETRARELGYHLEHFWMREPGLTHGRLSRILHTRGINGVIIASHVREIDVALQFDWTRFAAVKIDYFPHEPQLPLVTNDQLQIIRLAMQKVLAAGYRRIGFVIDEGWDITVDHLWRAGYLWEQQALAPADRLAPYLIPNREPLADWLRRTKPDAVIGKAEFVTATFKELGLRIPKDLAFVDIFLDDLSGKTAGVVQNHNEVGRLAVELLAGQLQQNKYGVPAIATTTYVEGTWRDGHSLPPRPGAASTPALGE